jgi:mevalonate kinase
MKKKKEFEPFPAKVLLFGEHIINRGARGLAVPTYNYSGFFRFEKLNDKAFTHSNQSLHKLAEFIIGNDAIQKHIDTNQLLSDIEDGLIFESNIPVGYGLGSSGALVAALVKAYGDKKILATNLHEQKKFLAAIESFFHGKSSGLDPIVSFTGEPLIVSDLSTERVTLKKSKNQYVDISLIDTHISRSTSTWVNHFLKRSKVAPFDKVLELSYKPANELCIESFLANKHASFWKALKIISQLQYDYLTDFIPKSFHQIWKDGLQNNEYYLKICGAGGGGFILCFSKTEAREQVLKSMEINSILRF